VTTAAPVKAKIKALAASFFLSYQARWIKDDARLKLMEKSRQIGISWSTAYRLVRNKAVAGAKNDAWISSRDDLQARLFKEDCNNFATILNAAAEDLGQIVIDRERAISAYVLQFASGVRIHSMSSNPDAQAGKRGDRVLDEFALHPDPRKLYSIAYPGITWGGSLEILSTHRGSANFFNTLVQEVRHKGNPKGFSIHRVTLQDALEAGFLAKLQPKLPKDDPRQDMDEAEYFAFIKAGCPDEETFLQEYMCLPADDAGAFLTYELIDGIKYKAGEKWELTMAELQASKNDLYLGGDIGRVRDLTSFWINERAAGVHLTRKRVDLQGATFDAQEAVLYEFLAMPRLKRACIDNTGIGRQLVERAQKRFGTYKVEAVTFTPAVKEELAYPVRAACEDRSLRIPDDPAVVSDFRAIRKETTAAGNIRFTAERTEGGHADRFWAAALALHAGKPAAGGFSSTII
jgi:phage FluMu gp28-like protein